MYVDNRRKAHKLLLVLVFISHHSLLFSVVKDASVQDFHWCPGWPNCLDFHFWRKITDRIKCAGRSNEAFGWRVLAFKGCWLFDMGTRALASNWCALTISQFFTYFQILFLQYHSFLGSFWFLCMDKYDKKIDAITLWTSQYAHQYHCFEPWG